MNRQLGHKEWSNDFRERTKITQIPHPTRHLFVSECAPDDANGHWVVIDVESMLAKNYNGRLNIIFVGGNVSSTKYLNLVGGGSGMLP